jgi:hypothetical protein
MVEHNALWATVHARIDVDGNCPTVIYETSRSGDLEAATIHMPPRDARRLARMLNRAAKAAEAMAG